MTFKPGKSGNPGGRSVAQREGEKRLAACIRGFAGEDFETYVERLHEIIVHGEHRDSLAGLKLAFDRVYGAAKQSIDMSVDTEPRAAVDWSAVPIERRREMLATIEEISAMVATPDEQH